MTSSELKINCEEVLIIRAIKAIRRNNKRPDNHSILGHINEINDENMDLLNVDKVMMDQQEKVPLTLLVN